MLKAIDIGFRDAHDGPELIDVGRYAGRGHAVAQCAEIFELAGACPARGMAEAAGKACLADDLAAVVDAAVAEAKPFSIAGGSSMMPVRCDHENATDVNGSEVVRAPTTTPRLLMSDAPVERFCGSSIRMGSETRTSSCASARMLDSDRKTRAEVPFGNVARLDMAPPSARQPLGILVVRDPRAGRRLTSPVRL